MTIKEQILLLKQDSNTYGSSLLLNYIELNFIEKMELEANSNAAFKDALDNMGSQLVKAKKDFTDYQAITEIKNIYSEALVLSRLQAQLHIEKIPESNTEKRPDYKAIFNGQDIYVEIKSLNMADGMNKPKSIMEQGLDSKISALDKLASGVVVAVTEQVINPYLFPHKEFDPRSVRQVIESLIDKINQNIKPGQYELGKTLLLIDLADQLTLLAHPEEELQEYYLDQNMDRPHQKEVSGVLWNTAFGNVDDKIIRAPEFEGAEVEAELLEREGILVSHPYILGLIFHHDRRFYGLASNRVDNVDVVDFLHYCTNGTVLN